MKKLLAIVLGVVLMGCVASNQTVYVETGNSNILELGRYRVLIDKRFIFVTSIDGKITRGNIDDPSGTPIKVIRHIFADTSNGTEIGRGIVIWDNQLKKSSQYYRGESSFSNYKKRHIDKGRTKLGDINVAYLARRVTSISSDVIDALSAKGLSVVNHQAIVIYFAKNIGRGRSITIGYVDATDEQNVMNAAKRFIKLSK
jgi:hypothetical protein